MWFKANIHAIQSSGWWRPIGCLISWITFRKLATNRGALLRKMTYKDKASYDSTPACRVHEILSECACDSELTWHSQQMWMRFTANIHAKPSLRDIHGKCGCDSERLYKRFWAYVTVRATVYEIQSECTCDLQRMHLRIIVNAHAIQSECIWGSESRWDSERT